jgi:hypothetical protein
MLNPATPPQPGVTAHARMCLRSSSVASSTPSAGSIFMSSAVTKVDICERSAFHIWHPAR